MRTSELLRALQPKAKESNPWCEPLGPNIQTARQSVQEVSNKMMVTFSRRIFCFSVIIVFFVYLSHR